MISWCQRAWCGWWHGHDQLQQYNGARMFLRCVNCGHETPGWTLDLPAPRRAWSRFYVGG